MSSTKVSVDEKAIDAIFSDLDQSHLPGAVVGIALKGRPVYRKAFGLASIELQVPLTPQTRLRIYSITKQFTCFAYLLLCEEGKAQLDDPVGKYLPELHPIVHRVTMRQLMSHTSGIRDACDIRWFFSGIQNLVPAQELLSCYRDISDVNSAPGESWSYNNGGFHILSNAIERITGEPLEEVFRKLIFQPVGMGDTLLRRTDSDFVSNSATMHMSTVDGRYEKKYLPGEFLGEGGIVSTVEDMLRWQAHVANPNGGSADAWTLMSTPQRLTDGRETGYGLGLFRHSYRGVDTIYHTGGGLGSNSQLVHLNEVGLDVVVMANRHDVSARALAGQIVDRCLGIDASQPPPEANANHVAGLFLSARSGRCISLYTKEGRQMGVVDGIQEWQLSLMEDRTLRPLPSVLSDFALRGWGDPVRPDSIRYEDFGNTDELSRVSTHSTSKSNLEAIAGRYHADSIGASVTIMGKGELGLVATAGRFGSARYLIASLGPHLWKIGASDTAFWGGVIAFDSRDDSFTFRGPRTWQVPFRRFA